MFRAIILLILAALLVVPASAQESATTSDESKTTGESSVLDVGRRLTDQFYQGKLEDIYQAFSPEMKEEFPLDRLTSVRNQVVEQLGPEIEVHDEQVTEQNGYVVYRRLVTFEKHRGGRFEVIWTVRDEDVVAGFFVRQAATQSE